MKLCMVCSSGGHFLELYFLRDFWKGFEHFWVTFFEKDNTQLLAGEKAYEAYHPTNRSVGNFFRNLLLAFAILKREKPGVIISTGAGVSVPFIYVGKLFNVKTIYIESATRVNSLSLSGRLVYPVVDHMLVQWPELAIKYKKAKFAGHII